MTAQEPDRFYYRNQRLDLVGFKGSELPVPSDFGIESYCLSTNCYRGYIMRYKIIESKLVLDGFWFNSMNEELLEINGVKPIELPGKYEMERDYMSGLFKYEYKNLNKKI